MSSDGTIVAVGATHNENLGGDVEAGHARVYQYNATSLPQWEQLGSDIDGESSGDFFGSTLAMSADGMTVVVGGNDNDGENPTTEVVGHVRVLKFNTMERRWEQIGADIDGEQSFARWGSSITMSADGTIIAIGSYIHVNQINGTETRGKVRVYQLNLSTEQYEQLGSDIDNIDARYLHYDENIAMSADGRSIAISEHISLKRTGRVRVYKYSSLSKQWRQGTADLNGPSTSKDFGEDITMSADGTRIAATSKIYVDRLTGPYHFHVHTFQFLKATSTWSQLGGDIIEFFECVRCSTFHSLDMSADGKTIAVGNAPISGRGSGIGKVRVFTYHDFSWEQLGSNITQAPDAPIGGTRSFASSVALSGDGTTVAVGAPYGGIGSEGQVAVYKFEPTAIINATCGILWNLYNSLTNNFVAPLLNGTIVSSAPPCNHINIEAVIPCAPMNGTVVLMELYSVSKTGVQTLVHSRRERQSKFFLFGSNRTDVYSGRIPSGTYMIRASVNGGLPSPLARFTLGGKCT